MSGPRGAAGDAAPATARPAHAAPAGVDVTAELGRWPLFAAVPEDTRAAVATGAHVVRLARGEVLFVRGTPARELYGVVDGLVQLDVSNVDGAVRVVELIRPGGTLGEAVMFLGRPFPVDARALEDTVLVRIPASVVDARLAADPTFARAMLASLSVRLHALVQEVEAHSLQTAGQRVAGHLLAHAGEARPAVVALAPSKRVVASRLAMTPETFSRALRGLSDAGLVAVAGREVTVLDADGLRRYAAGR